MTILKNPLSTSEVSPLHVRGTRSDRARARQPPRFPSARRVFTPRRTRGVGASMLSRLTLRAAARAMRCRESARYVAPASAPIDPFARCDHPRPCLRRECSCLAPSTSPRARAYRAGTDALLTRSCAPTLDRPSPFPTAEELLDEEIQAEEEGGFQAPSPARLRYSSAEPRKRTPDLPLVPTFTRHEKMPPRLTQPRRLPDTQGQGRGASLRG